MLSSVKAHAMTYRRFTAELTGVGMNRLAALVAICLSVVALPPARADDAIEGVQPAALDQPRIYINLRRTAGGPTLQAKTPRDGNAGAAAKILKDLGLDAGGDADPSTLEAFLDTGASGLVLSASTVEQLGIRLERGRDGKDVVFEDVGIGGSEKFAVAEPLLVSLAAYPDGDGAFAPAGAAAIRAQVRPEAGILALVAPGLDVAGMPVMYGRVVVLDPAPLAKFDKIRTAVVAAGDRSIPKARIRVPLTYVSFEPFTRTAPPGAPGPAVLGNPMIGPDPFKPGGDGRKPVVLVHGGKRAEATLLPDTGAAASIISIAMARKLGLKVTDAGGLPDVPKDRSFSLPIGGIGGMRVASGIYLDRMELPNAAGPPVAYAGAPFLIADITVTGRDGKTFTLDGVLGMNFLVASAEVTGGLLPDIGRIVEGPFKAIVIDLKRGELGLEPR